MMKIVLLISLLTVSSLPLNSVAGDLIIPQRALSCESLKLSELDKLNKTELESYYCGNILGDAKSEKRSKSKSTDNADRDIIKAKTRLKEMKMCQSSKTKVRKLYDGKFLAELIDCSKFTGFSKEGDPDIE